MSGEAAVHINEVCRAQQDAWMGSNGVMRHRYRRCGFSGSGNCCCGRAKESPLHPHEFVAWWRDNDRCVCSRWKADLIHSSEAAL